MTEEREGAVNDELLLGQSTSLELTSISTQNPVSQETLSPGPTGTVCHSCYQASAQQRHMGLSPAGESRQVA